MDHELLSRLQFLTAEIFAYSYANYANHLGIGHERFEKLMPDNALKLEQAVRENWNISRVADELDVDSDTAASLLASTRDAIKVVDAENPAAAFRESMTQLLTKAAEEGLTTDDAIKNVVTQICYRVSDLGYLLAAENSDLKTYCQEFRREPGD